MLLFYYKLIIYDLFITLSLYKQGMEKQPALYNILFDPSNKTIKCQVTMDTYRYHRMVQSRIEYTDKYKIHHC